MLQTREDGGKPFTRNYEQARAIIKAKFELCYKYFAMLDKDIPALNLHAPTEDISST